MAIYLEFINLIIPRAAVEKRYPGGWDQCLSDGNFMWHDDNLIRIGAMSPMDMSGLVDYWKGLGFKPIQSKNREKHWNEMCVVEGISGAPTLPCDWIEISDDGVSAWLKGTDPGEIAGPS